MRIPPPLDAIDTRVVFKGYAVIAWMVGLALFGWGPMWFGVHLPQLPYGVAVLIRILGAVIIAAGCLSRAVAGAADPEGRRSGLLWFAIGHGVVLLVVTMQLFVVWEKPGPAGHLAMGSLASAALLFWYFWWSAEGHPIAGLGQAALPQDARSLFRRGREQPSIQRLRSTYEDQIRAAASQEERNRLARDLHDSVKQQIFAIQTAAATAQVRLQADASGAGTAIEQVRSSAREAMTEMEAMLDQLRAAPLENTGLVEALRKQCEALGYRTGAEVDFRPGPLPPNEEMPPGAQQAIFRVAQEAMANVGRHARASHVRLSLISADGEIRLEVEDDGRGFDAGQPGRGMGIANMRARAEEWGGRLTLASEPGKGTAVRLAIPFNRSDPDELWFQRRRVLVWGVLAGAFTALVLVDIAVPWRRQFLSWEVPLMLVNAFTFARILLAYRRLREAHEPHEVRP